MIFELQNLKLQEEKLETGLRKTHSEIEKYTEKINSKRNENVVELNRLREKLHKDPKITNLKAQMTELNKLAIDSEDLINETTTAIEEEMNQLESLNTEFRIKKMYSLSNEETLEELIEMENYTIRRAEEQLNQVNIGTLNIFIFYMKFNISIN